MVLVQSTALHYLILLLSHQQVLTNVSCLIAKLFLHDVLSTSSTEKFQTLNFNLDKTHNVNSCQTLDSHYLNNLFQKDLTAWSKKGDKNS